MSEAVDGTPALLFPENLYLLTDEWAHLVSCPEHPMPFWQLISMVVGEVLYRARDGRPVYSEDAHEAAAMVAAAGTWRLEIQGTDPYADWRSRVLPVFGRIAETAPRRPFMHRRMWSPSRATASPTLTRTANCGRRMTPPLHVITFPMPH